jgi:glycosyltransferase involved in cell wall biosynthesis
MLKLVTISRMSAEKGFKRMAIMQDLIQEPFIWDVYGMGNLNMMKPLTKCTYKGITDEPLQVIKEYDFVVQLSDTEGMPFVILEALSVSVPVIVTAFPSAFEIVEHQKNGYIFDFELKNFIPLKKLTFQYKPKATVKDWIKFINHG